MSAVSYDSAAKLIGSNTRDVIEAFWRHFAQNADTLRRWFFNQENGTQTVTDIMQPLREVSPNLTRELGPAEDGHLLTITADLQDANRPLAWLTLHIAPNWTFTDARHSALNPAQASGGWVVAGYGADQAYIDFAVTEVARAVALLRNHFGKEKHAANASLHVLDRGQRDISIPLAPST